MFALNEKYFASFFEYQIDTAIRASILILYNCKTLHAENLTYEQFKIFPIDIVQRIIRFSATGSLNKILTFALFDKRCQCTQ